MSRLYEFKITGSGGKTVYIDNIYFFNDISDGTPDIQPTASVRCYPGLVAGRLTVSAGSPIYRITVCNLLGQPLKSARTVGNESIIDLIQFAAGNYFVTVELSSGERVTQKIVKL